MLYERDSTTKLLIKKKTIIFSKKKTKNKSINTKFMVKQKQCSKFKKMLIKG